MNEHRVEAVRQLAAGIAHEFANALTAIGGLAHLIQLEGTFDAQARQDFDEIAKITQDAAFLARELMAFGLTPLADPAARPLNALATQLRHVLPHVLPPNVRIDERLASADVAVSADPQQINEITIVVAVHARDRMQNGGELLVQTRLETLDARAAGALPPGQYGILEIAGRAATDGAAVEYSAAASEALADAARVLTRTGANLSIRDDAGGVMRFLIYLPVASRDGDRQPTRRAPAGGSERILLLEDDDVLADIVTRVLQARGYQVVRARDGATALEMAAALDVDLLLSDVVVPGPAGLELRERFVAARPQAKVLFMSGHALDMAADVPFIRKPFDADDLSRKVRDLLDTPPFRR